MASQHSALLEALVKSPARRSLLGIRRGIEKESLRVTPEGVLAPTPHPRGLGSALTHPHITTDFSEAQLELITDVFTDVEGCLGQLEEIHAWVYRQIGEEILWAASMPCVLPGDENIPVGRYGSSNTGMLKTVYRRGLGIRYGRVMQTISGIHYNFSMPETFWSWLAEHSGWHGELDELVTASYFGLIRNFRRTSWLLLYLLGASPAVCRTFLEGRTHDLEPIGEGSLHLPYATSLRMGKLGYQSDAQAALPVSYNSLESFARTLEQALNRPYPPYETLGLQRDGEFQQLSTSLLQIENEFYGTIRPKRGTLPGERPLRALDERGVEYVEVRCLDLDPFLPLGIDAETILFLDAFLLHCLLDDSPPDTPEEIAALNRNQARVVEEGRRPGLALEDGDRWRSLEEWGGALLEGCARAASAIDAARGDDACSAAVRTMSTRLADAERTPSARILAAMRREGVPYFRVAMDLSEANARHFRSVVVDVERLARESEASLAEQARIEGADDVDFDTYRRRFIEQPLLVERNVSRATR